MQAAIDFLAASHPVEMPAWLAAIDPAKPATPAKVLKDFLGSRLVFYPGSGSDGSPVALFNSARAAACFVYVDLHLEQDALFNELAHNGFRGYQSIARVDVQEADFAIGHWQSHLTAAEMAEAPKPVPAYGFIEILEMSRPDVPGYPRIAILFLRADGPAAYDAMFCQSSKSGQAPYCIVIQDHGYAEIWSLFGQGGALATIASRADVYPRLLIVAEDSLAWDGYTQVDLTEFHGGVHGNRRHLFVRASHSS